MNPSKLSSQLEPELDVEIKPQQEHTPSAWFLLEVKPNSKAEEYLVYLLVGAATETITGLRYSAECEAQSISEALAEFAHVGHCEQGLYLRLLFKQMLQG